MVNYVPTSETENLTAKNIVRYVDECNRDSSYFKLFQNQFWISLRPVPISKSKL